MLCAARHALRRAGLAAGQQGLLHRMEDCAAAVGRPTLALWPGASAEDGTCCSVLVPQPGSRHLCITAESGSRHTSGAEASPSGNTAGGHASHQAASSSGSYGGSAEEASAADEDAEADARATETRQRILEAAMGHVVRTACGALCCLTREFSIGSLVCIVVANVLYATAPPHASSSALDMGGAGGLQQIRCNTALEMPVPNVPVPDLQGEKGWTVAALQAGARDCGLSPAAAALVADHEAGLVQVSTEWQR